MLKKLLLLVAGLTLCVSLFAETIGVAVLPAIDRENEVHKAYKFSIRQYIVTGITLVDGYEAYDRINLGTVLDEQKFQRDGMVKAADIKKIGEMTGAQYVLIIEVMSFPKNPDVIFVSAQFEDVETARIIQSATSKVHVTNEELLEQECVGLAQRLLGVPVSIRPSAKAQNPYSSASNASSSQKSPKASNQVVTDFVDLGLSVKWATCNLGASSPEESGELYAWGEIKRKELFGWDTYKWGTISGVTVLFPKITITKYNYKTKSGQVDDLYTLEESDDVATVKYGRGCRIPTEEEWKELISYCKWEWTSLNGVMGYKVRNMENGESIFLPMVQSSIGNPKQKIINFGCIFWSSSLSKTEPNAAMTLSINKNGFMISSAFRCAGAPIRPVSE